jgi:FKBP-type peptidyl-prolyl cis-trans isomerase SlyD
MSATIAEKKIVSIHYTLKNDAGDTLDTSAEAEPLAYLHGAGNIVPGLERALDGKAVGDKVSAVVAPVDGYGERAGPGPQPVPKAAFEGADVQPGMAVVAEDQEGNQMPLWIVAVEDDRVMVDNNHPLAGETLHFDVEVMEIRDATEQELAHGHVHADGHDH